MRACPFPAEMQTAECSRISVLTLGTVPIRPRVPSPQDSTCPDTNVRDSLIADRLPDIARENRLPAAIDMIWCLLRIEIDRGKLDRVTFSTPSCPYALLPKPYTNVRFPTTVSTREWSDPAAIFSIACPRRASISVTEELPGRPKQFRPHVHKDRTVDFPIARQWASPAAICITLTQRRASICLGVDE